MSTEPEIVVTEADRRATWEEVAKRDVALGDCPLEILAWIVGGDESLVPGSLSVFPAISHAIARARTMAAFEERVANVIKCLEVTGGFASACKISGVDLYDSPISVFEEGEDIDIDAVRALVLKGWRT